MLGFAAGSALGAVSTTTGNFTFDSLTLGSLVGQDGWTSSGTEPSPTLQIGGGVNSTLAAAGSSPINGNAEEAAVHAGGGVGGLLGTGGTSGQFITLQMQAMEHHYYQSVFGVGQRVSGSIFNNISLGFFMGISDGDVWFGREETGAITSYALLDIKPTYNPGDWYEVKGVVDLLANGGNGSGSLFVRDLTDGESLFTAVPDAQNVDLSILSSPAPNPAQWDGAVLWLSGGYGGSGAADTLSYQVVPEPASASLMLLLAALSWRRFLSPRQKPRA
jgi:hypothetical protein